MSTSMFQTFRDYEVPLLRLLSTFEGGQGQVGEVRNDFAERYEHNIPGDHYDLLKDGRARWYKFVRLARRQLIDCGFVDAPARGVWRITEAGSQWLQDHSEATRLDPEQRARQARSRRRRSVALVGVTLEQLKATKAAMPADQFHPIWGELYDRLLAQERAHSKTSVSNRELGTRARAVLNEVHDSLGGNVAASSEKAYDWMQFCYALRLYRETAALFAFVSQDDLPEWAYERARKMAEACRARVSS